MTVAAFTRQLEALRSEQARAAFLPVEQKVGEEKQKMGAVSAFWLWGAFGCRSERDIPDLRF